MHYTLNVAGLQRQLPICKVTDDLYIAAFVVFGDAELTVACARDLLKLVDMDSFDYMLTAEAKGIPLIHEMARQSGAEKYILARKGAKVYMPNPIHVEDESITTAGRQELYLGRDDAELIRGKRVLLVDDVISTGGSLHAMEELVLGYPKNMDGTLGPRAEKAEAMAVLLREATGLPVVLWDERRTTIDAHQILMTGGKNAKKRKKVVDAVAASLILEGYLTYKKSHP